jgi:hypothetical protein
MAIRQEEARSVTGAQIALVVLVVIALLVGAWFFFLRSDTDESAALALPVSTPLPTPEPTEAARKPGRGPVETFEVFAPKDPFKPAIAEVSTGGAPAPTGTPAPGTGITGDGTNGSVTTGGNGNGNARGDTVGGHRIRLVDVFTNNGRQQARVQVDGTVYTVREGDRFAANFEVLSIEGRCASLLFGDDQFTLCEGEEILK